MANADRPRVVVFSLGGTITMVPTPDGGVSPALTGADLIDTVPGLDEVPVELDVHDFRHLPGASLSFADLLELSAEIRRAVSDGAAGVVVSQGTDTIEETAYLLDLTYDADAPIVVTGAMRNPSMAGADGPANLLAAIRTAANDTARGLGCLVVFADQIHAARWVTKSHTSSPAAFTSPDHGPLGHVIEGRVHIPLRINRGPIVKNAAPSQIPTVGLATTTLGDDGTLLTAIGERADALVIAAFGVGHVPAATVPILTGLARRIPVVLTSRTGAGPVHEATYRYPGSEIDLLERGLISAGHLHPLKARILLCLLLAAGKPKPEIIRTLGAAGGHTGAGHPPPA